MWKHILGQSIYQLIVLFFITFAGENFIPENASEDVSSPSYKMWYDNDDPDTGRIRSGRKKTIWTGHDDFSKEYFDEIGPSRHLTIVFNTFVFMQLFNEFNTRKLNDEINIFKNIFASKMFIGIWFLCIIVQIIMVQFGSYVSSCCVAGLTPVQWVICIGFGAGTLIWGVLLRALPDKCCL